jgi:hypothetical protein
MDEINRKRLEHIATIQEGELLPEPLFSGAYWREIAEMAKQAHDELATYRGIKVDIEHETLHIDGIKYARSLFEGIGLKTAPNRWLRIRERTPDGLVIIEMATPDGVLGDLWQPIETAPVAPWTPELPSYYRFRCILQVKPTWVQEGEGYWIVPHRGKDRTPQLRWRTHLGMCQPTHFMPLPAPFNEPVNEPLNEGER